MTIRVLVADDQDMVRRGLCGILSQQPDIEVVGEAADGVEALDGVLQLRPDVLLLDIRMPRMDGIEVTRNVMENRGTDDVRIVLVTTFDLDDYVFAALRYGASGFLLKRSGPALIVEAVRAAVAGEMLISPSITVRLLQRLAAYSKTAAAARPRDPLTRREVEVAAQVAQGKTNADIATTLFITPGTVKTHVANVQRKLGVRNRVGIAVAAWELGYVSDDRQRSE